MTKNILIGALVVVVVALAVIVLIPKGQEVSPQIAYSPSPEISSVPSESVSTDNASIKSRSINDIAFPTSLIVTEIKDMPDERNMIRDDGAGTYGIGAISPYVELANFRFTSPIYGLDEPDAGIHREMVYIYNVAKNTIVAKGLSTTEYQAITNQGSLVRLYVAPIPCVSPGCGVYVFAVMPDNFIFTFVFPSDLNPDPILNELFKISYK